MDRLILHSGYEKRDSEERFKASSISEYFAAMNQVYDNVPPAPPQDLCLLNLEEIKGTKWPPSVSILLDPLPATPRTEPDTLPKGECFVIGSPNGLALKISGHARGRTSPRIVKSVQGFYANFNCDVDALGGRFRVNRIYRQTLICSCRQLRWTNLLPRSPISRRNLGHRTRAARKGNKLGTEF